MVHVLLMGGHMTSINLGEHFAHFVQQQIEHGRYQVAALHTSDGRRLDGPGVDSA